jgi:hypothetical protein
VSQIDQNRQTNQADGQGHKEKGECKMNTSVYEVSRSVDNPKGGDKIKRVAKVTIPLVHNPDKGVTATLDSLMSFAAEIAAVTGAKDPVEALGRIVQNSITDEARTYGYQFLGKGDEISKQIQKTVDAFKNIPVLASKSEDELRQYVLAADPTLKAAFENQNIELEVSLDADVKRLFGDNRKKEESDTVAA